MSDKEKVTVEWVSNMAFEADVKGNKIMLDAEPNVGGGKRGAPPKPLMLVALGGCTGMDVISILKKMRVDIEGFKVSVEGELTGEHPRYFNKMHVIYEFTGKNLPLDKLQKAISLSEEKYCGVSAVYNKVMQITSEIKINET